MLNWVEHENSFITSGPGNGVLLQPVQEGVSSIADVINGIEDIQ